MTFFNYFNTPSTSQNRSSVNGPLKQLNHDRKNQHYPKLIYKVTPPKKSSFSEDISEMLAFGAH